jgi:hypothetical protein
MSDSHITVTSFFSDSSWNKMCLWNTMYTHHIYMTFVLDLWPWRMTLTFHHSKCAAPWGTHACQISSCYLQYCKIWPLTLNFDLEGWLWPWPFTTQNVQLHEIHMHAKYQVAIFNICISYGKCKSLTLTNKPTNKPTDRANTICPPV